MAIGPTKLLPVPKDCRYIATSGNCYHPQPQFMRLGILPFIFLLFL